MTATCILRIGHALFYFEPYTVCVYDLDEQANQELNDRMYMCSCDVYMGYDDWVGSIQNIFFILDISRSVLSGLLFKSFCPLFIYQGILYFCFYV